MKLPLPHRLANTRLRALRRGDLPEFLVYRGDPLVARYQGWECMSRAQALAFIDAQAPGAALHPGSWRQLGVADAETDALIGDVGIWLAPDAASAEFGLSIARTRQGRGLGTEVVSGVLALLFAATTVTEVLASTDVRNTACTVALERAGMARIGTHQGEFKGEACIEYRYRATRQTA
jgi:RimJ/RimL family protein N-acetyltransferase